MGAHDFKYNKVALFLLKKQGISSLLLRCNLVISQCMCQVLLRLKDVQMGTHDFKYNKVPLFGRKTGNINTSMAAAPNWLLCQQAVITAMQHGHTTMYVPSFIKIERGSDGDP